MYRGSVAAGVNHEKESTPLPDTREAKKWWAFNYRLVYCCHFYHLNVSLKGYLPDSVRHYKPLSRAASGTAAHWREYLQMRLGAFITSELYETELCSRTWHICTKYHKKRGWQAVSPSAVVAIFLMFHHHCGTLVMHMKARQPPAGMVTHQCILHSTDLSYTFIWSLNMLIITFHTYFLCQWLWTIINPTSKEQARSHSWLSPVISVGPRQPEIMAIITFVTITASGVAILALGKGEREKKKLHIHMIKSNRPCGRYSKEATFNPSC